MNTCIRCSNSWVGKVSAPKSCPACKSLSWNTPYKHRNPVGAHATKDAYKSDPTFSSWRAMKRRCLNAKDNRFCDYGGRGITIDPSWLTYSKFLQDMGIRTAGTTLERLDTNGNYEMGNCTWATPKAQQNNTRRCIFLDHDGRRQTIQQWSDETGIPYRRLHARVVRSGWSAKDALTTPAQKRSK